MIITVVLLVVAGGLGAVARFVIDGAVRSRIGPGSPLGTVLINVSGSLVLGLVTGLTLSHALPEAVQLVVGTGFLGGYTTFSTASFETVRLVQVQRLRAALLNGFGTLLTTTLAAGKTVSPSISPTIESVR